MESFRRLTHFTVMRDTLLVALAAATLMVGFSFEPSLAFMIGANIALLFCLGLIFRAWRLDRDAEHILQTEPWRGLALAERPVGDHERLWARDLLKERWLRAAKAAALAAIVLAGSSLIVAANSSPAPDLVAMADTPPSVAHDDSLTTAEAAEIWSWRLMQMY